MKEASQTKKPLEVHLVWNFVPNKYDDIYSDENASEFIYKHWGDKKMLRTFPNLKVQDVNGNMIYMDSLLSDIQPYYYKFNIKK